MVMTPVERQQWSREGRRSDVARIAQRLDAVEDLLKRVLAAVEKPKVERLRPRGELRGFEDVDVEEVDG
jgi:hypothetical protein